MSRTFTILSGDLLRSTELDDAMLHSAFDGLRKATALIEGWHGAPVHFTRNRGDGWQICLPGTAPGLREALALRAGLKCQDRHLDTRIAVASGTAELPGDGDLNRATGPAFTQAGRLLDTLKGADMDHAAGGALSAAYLLAAEISQGWTQAQARAVLPMLAPDPPIHAEIAARHDITRQAVRQALSAAGYPALAKALARIEDTP